MGSGTRGPDAAGARREAVAAEGVARVSHYPPGELPERTNPGDVGFTDGDYWVADKITELQVAAGYPSEYASWGHMFCVQDATLGISEALERGVEYEHLRKYRDVHFSIAELDVATALRDSAVAFGWSVLDARRRYSYETILLMWAQIRLTQAARWTGWREPEDGFDFAVAFQRTNTAICSGYGCEWLRSAGWVWPKGAAYVMPAQAAEVLGARRFG